MDTPDAQRGPHPALVSFLEHMTRIEASDLYLLADRPPVFRVHDVMYPSRVALDEAQLTSMVGSLLDDTRREQLAAGLGPCFCISIGAGARFRFSVFRQRGTLGIVVRALRAQLGELDELGCPELLKDLALAKGGLVLVVGPSSCGKSTTLASMVDHRNTLQGGYILTIEEPIELLHVHKQSVVAQREVGSDTPSYQSALRAALYQAVDMVMIAELRDGASMDAALTLAESGTLCVAAMRTTGAVAAIERAQSFFAADRQDELRSRLSTTLLATISQQLVPLRDNRRIASFEVLDVASPQARQLVRRGDTDGLRASLPLQARPALAALEQIAHQPLRLAT